MKTFKMMTSDFDIKHTFVTSDHHFGSWQLIPMFTVFSKDDEQGLVEKWNSVVNEDDLVLYNGDFCDCNVLDFCKYINQLNGRKILVKGNHDIYPDEVYKTAFEDVVDEIVIPSLDLTIHHSPANVTTTYEVFGHIHRSGIYQFSKPNSFCSCVQSNDGFPVSLEKMMSTMYNLNKN